MIALTFAAWGFLGFIIGMLGMTAWIDRSRVRRASPQDARFNPYLDEARAYAEERR